MPEAAANPPEDVQAVFDRGFGPPAATHLVQAPGRVNLMGDHIDYNGLPVLPIAIQRRVFLLYRERDDATVRLVNADERYPAREFVLSETIEPSPEGDWSNYVKAAARALAQRFDVRRGFDAAVGSDIPTAAGLSSSSALVVAGALAVLHVNEIWVDRMELAELLAAAEHYVGTRGGGMDQAICLAARRHSASRIDFGPLRLTAHPIPPEWHFVVAFSLMPAEKSGVARETYNTRVRECREALTRVAEALGLTGRVDSYPALMAERPVAALIETADAVLEDPLARRFRHVLTEAERVRRAERALLAYDLRGFGRLMSDSHHSLRDDFEVSRPELDELVDISTRAGAAGARLTGAGLGGCIIALCPVVRAPRVLDALARRYYAERGAQEPLEQILFVAEPSGGASVAPL
jgi:galactokinase